MSWYFAGASFFFVTAGLATAGYLLYVTFRSLGSPPSRPRQSADTNDLVMAVSMAAIAMLCGLAAVASAVLASSL